VNLDKLGALALRRSLRPISARLLAAEASGISAKNGAPLRGDPGNHLSAGICHSGLKRLEHNTSTRG
jgi:hypothetical protein